MAVTQKVHIIEFTKEQAQTPANPPRDRAKLYIKDNGGSPGKSQLIVRFGSGAEQVLATEP